MNVQFKKSAISVIFPEHGSKFVNKEGETFYHFPFYLRTTDGETFTMLESGDLPPAALEFFDKESHL